MSDLQMGLILLGLALILLVVLFNWWQDWKARRRWQPHAPANNADPLLADANASARREPVLGDLPEHNADDEEVDPRIEAVIDVNFAHPVAAEALIPALQALVVASPKPVRIFAQGADADERVRLTPGAACLNLQLAVLLANRAGPLTGIAWSSIWTAAQALAEPFDGVVEGPELDAVVRDAAALDAACADLDAAVNLQLRLTAAAPAEQILASAHAAGFVRRGTHLVWVDAAGCPGFTLIANGEAIADLPAGRGMERLDLVLDVPNTPPHREAFSRMAAVGRDLAARVQAVLLDDQGQPLATGAETTIDTQLHALTQRLEHAGFVPGSPRCARVFA